MVLTQSQRSDQTRRYGSPGDMPPSTAEDEQRDDLATISRVATMLRAQGQTELPDEIPDPSPIGPPEVPRREPFSSRVTIGGEGAVLGGKEEEAFARLVGLNQPAGVGRAPLARPTFVFQGLRRVVRSDGFPGTPASSGVSTMPKALAFGSMTARWVPSSSVRCGGRRHRSSATPSLGRRGRALERPTVRLYRCPGGGECPSACVTPGSVADDADEPCERTRHRLVQALRKPRHRRLCVFSHSELCLVPSWRGDPPLGDAGDHHGRDPAMPRMRELQRGGG